jgi:predicted unusual protein kinase regulating ubiquinone biosynthesis (AarF/ABC1/UbiB family)
LADILNPWFEALKKPNATLAEKSATSVFLKTVKEGERHGVRFPKEMVLFFRSLSILDMIALHINPNFDIIKALNCFFDKYPLEEIEKIINESGRAGDLREKIISTADIDWESFREVALLEKERMMQARERVIDLITYYAERYEELRPLIKSYKQ